VPASAKAATKPAPATASAAAKRQASAMERLVLIPLSIALAALCWGSYGPILHKGQMKMAGSRLRPFLCVGLAYFVIAVIVPLPLLQFFREPGGFNLSGTAWSMAGGAAGAIGALGIIMAFNFGGKPIYVMPLVFGGAPVVNTFTTVLAEGTYSDLSPLFLASLIVVIAGATTVLVFAPRHAKPAADPPVAKPPQPVSQGPSSPPGKPAWADQPQPDSSSCGILEEDLEDTIDSEETVLKRNKD
jgi:hypothetical protein